MSQLSCLFPNSLFARPLPSLVLDVSILNHRHNTKYFPGIKFWFHLLIPCRQSDVQSVCLRHVYNRISEDSLYLSFYQQILSRKIEKFLFSESAKILFFQNHQLINSETFCKEMLKEAWHIYIVCNILYIVDVLLITLCGTLVQLPAWQQDRTRLRTNVTTYSLKQSLTRTFDEKDTSG